MNSAEVLAMTKGTVISIRTIPRYTFEIEKRSDKDRVYTMNFLLEGKRIGKKLYVGFESLLRCEHIIKIIRKK